MNRMTLFLLVLLSLVASLNFVAIADGSTAASGSGDHKDNLLTPFVVPTTPWPLQCRIPPYSNPARIKTYPIGVTVEESSELLAAEGRCYVACAAQIVTKQSDTEKNDLSIYWPYFREFNCRFSKMIRECTRGCILAYREPHRNSNTTCPQTCLDSCILECGGEDSCDMNPHDPWTQCPLECATKRSIDKPKNSCNMGCTKANTLKEYIGSLPHDPIGSPTLRLDQSRDRVGRFTIDVRDAAPQPQAGELNQTSVISTLPVTFLFRFEDMASNNVSFLWTANPSAHLDLADYACQELQVSFAVANEAGLSNFSSLVVIYVPGDERKIPNPPTSIRFTEAIDKRAGFFGHVTLNITWDEPQNKVYVDNSTVVVSPANGVNPVCGNETWNRTVPSGITTVVIEAESPHSLPVMDCTYSIQVYTTGVDGSSNPLRRSYPIPAFAPDCIRFVCEQLWQTTSHLFWFNLTWIIPDYLREGDIIKEFVINARIKDGNGFILNSIVTSQILVTFEHKNRVTTFTVKPDNTKRMDYHYPHHDSSWKYSIETYIKWNSDSLVYTPPPHTYKCEKSVVSPAPSPVNNFTVISYNLAPNGMLTSYDVCIGSEPLSPEEDVQPNTGHICGNLKEETHVITLKFFRSECLFVQIRANNRYVPGNWSEPDVISFQPGLCKIQQQEPTESQGELKESQGELKDSQSELKESQAGVIAGAIIGCLLLTAFSACCVFLTTMYIWMARKRKRLLRITQEPCDDPMFSSRSKKIFLHQPVSSPVTSPQKDEWEIPPNEVLIEDCLGEGAFGEVYRGVVKCPIINPKVHLSAKNAFCTPVAIKLLKMSAKGNERQDFLSEIEMMKKVAEGQNPHVVGLLGCVTIQEPLCLITEFVKYGDLLSYLRTNRRMNVGNSTDEGNAGNAAYSVLGNVSPADLMSFAYQIASGMEYLASLGIVHRDLACRNILVDEGKVLKITDFGMSRETDEIYIQKRTGRVPLKWMAIESIIAREFTSASDVWSYGVTLWEIGTLGGFPYPSIQNEDLLSLLKRGYRMEKPDNCSTEVYDIMLMCWNEEPQRRPTFTELRAKFDAMLLAEKKNPYIDLRIDNDKPYYKLDTMTTITGNGLNLSPNPSRHSFTPSTSSGNGNKGGGYECSPKPSCTPTLSPSHHFHTSCCSSTQASPQKLAVTNVTPSLTPSPCHESCEYTQSASESERRERDNFHETRRRPISLLLPQDRERRERQNPYVEEPSRLAATVALALSSEHTHRESDGDIELNHLLRNTENLETGIVITISGD